MPQEQVIEKNVDAVTGRLRAYIVDNFLLGKDNGFLTTDSLYETGILDSTSIMELVAFIEDSYGIAVDDEDLTEQNLGSLARISAFVERKAQA